MNLYKEEEYKEKFPVISKAVDGYLTEFGIDISKYYFSEFDSFKSDDIFYYSVSYGHKSNEDVTLFFCVALDGEETRLEQLNLSSD